MTVCRSDPLASRRRRGLHNPVTLATSSGSVEDLNVSTFQGWMPCTRHTRVTVPFPTSRCDTRSCESQCVTPLVMFTKPERGARTLVKAFAA